MGRAILICAALAAVCGAQQPSEPMQLLIQMRHKLVESIGRIPNFLCTEAVDRNTFRADPHVRADSSCKEILATGEPLDRKHLRSIDRLRLDVGVANNKEIYSWVGEGKFGDQSLSQLVKTGSTSTGSFASFLHSIFVAEGATFSYQDEEKWNGRRALRYAFEVPLWRSGYTISSKTVRRLVGYSGTFLMDSETLDLLRLEIQADNIPQELNMCATTTVLNYEIVNMNQQDFLLPSEATTHVVSRNGLQAINHTVFSGCHQFLGESKLIFDDQPATSEAARTVKQKSFDLPVGLSLSIALGENIDPSSAAAGEAVRGKLSRPLEIPALRFTVPKGAVVNGRISELFTQYGDVTSLEFGLRWESIEIEGNTVPLRLSLDEPVAGTAKSPSVFVRIHEQVDDGIGYFFIPDIGKKYQIPAGFEARWTSQKP